MPGMDIGWVLKRRKARGRRRNSRPAVLILLGAALVLASFGETSGAGHATVWKGIYTKAQAVRGETAFDVHCSSCHQPDLSGQGHLLVGQSFMEHWREDNVGSFFHRLKNTMPRGAPASLSDRVYLEMVAFILQANGFPAGKTELTLASLGSIQIEDRDGPKAVPEFALVKTVGCLEKSASGEWTLEHASPAARTRNPDASTETELRAAAALSGTGEFHFLRLMPYDVTAYKMEAQKAHRVEAKGFLMRKAGQELLNLTSVTTVQASCSQ